MLCPGLKPHKQSMGPSTPLCQHGTWVLPGHEAKAMIECSTKASQWERSLAVLSQPALTSPVLPPADVHMCKNLPCASLSFRCKSLFFIWGHSVPSETISWHFYSRHVGGTVGQQRRWQTVCELNTGHSIRANSVKWKEGQVTELLWGGTLGIATWCSWELWSNWWGAYIRRKRVLQSLMGWSEKVGHVELSQVLSVESLWISGIPVGLSFTP